MNRNNHWYKEYLSVYGKSYTEIPEEVMTSVRERIFQLQSSEPLATISVIAYNEEHHLMSCLWSLSMTQCRYPIEIIGVNNLSTDRTATLFEKVGIPFFNESHPGCGHARQCGLSHARGRYHINIDADTMYPPLYVQTLIEELVKPGIVGVCSTWSYFPDKKHSSLGLILYEAARDIYLWLQHFKRPELSVRGLVFAYDTQLARQIGIRTDIIRGEDGSLALELKKHGRIAFIHHSKARAITGYGTVGNDGSLLNSFKVRAIKALKNLGGLFYKKKTYKDSKENLIKNK